jgi:hypothetical protein
MTAKINFTGKLILAAADLPHGNISDNKIKAKRVRLGTGYELWANTAINVIKKLDDILSVMEEIKTPESIKKHFDPNWDAKFLSAQ